MHAQTNKQRLFRLFLQHLSNGDVRVKDVKDLPK